MRVASVFMIMPPAELNEELAKHADQFQCYLATEFPGYQFQVVDLRMLRPVERGQKVRFGDGTTFAVLPLMGSTGVGERTVEMPPSELILEISEACSRFSVNRRRYVA